MKHQQLFVALALTIAVVACTKDRPERRGDPCDPPTVENVIFDSSAFSMPDAYQQAGAYSIWVCGNTMSATVLYTGCDDQHDIAILTDGLTLRTDPPGRRLRFVVLDPDTCADMQMRTELFDLVPLRVPGTNYVWLRIDETQVLYSY